MSKPELANAPEVAALLLAVFLSDAAKDFRKAVAGAKSRRRRAGWSTAARTAWTAFASVFKLADAVWPTGAVRRAPSPTKAAAAVLAEAAEPAQRLANEEGLR